MDRNLLRLVSWWLVVFYSLSATATNPRPLVRGVRPQLLAIKQQRQQQQRQSTELVVPPRPVVVKCHPDSMEVVVQADMLDTGLKVDGAHLQLGSNSPNQGIQCGAVRSGDEEFTILARLTDCGTKLSSTEEKIIYSNVLTHSPKPSLDGLLRLGEAAVPVQCHYDRRYSVDGISLYPAWVPLVSIESVDDQINFNLQIMSDDWRFERGSYTLFLGDLINFEVSIVLGHHLPLRVFVDHCVATATPDIEAALRYDFIEHYGCLADGYLTNSNSLFLPRVEEHKLRFQLVAFRFYQEPSNQLYITCSVKAVPITQAVNSQNKACFLVGNRWKSVDGTDQACRSCDVSQRFEKAQTTEPPKTITSTIGRPMSSREHLLQSKAEHYPVNYLSFRPGMFKRHQRNTDYKEHKSAHVGPLTVLPSRKSDSQEVRQ